MEGIRLLALGLTGDENDCGSHDSEGGLRGTRPDTGPVAGLLRGGQRGLGDMVSFIDDLVRLIAELCLYAGNSSRHSRSWS